MGSKPLRPTDRNFVLPHDAAQLPPHIKRQYTICNLFANQQLPVHKIMRVLDEPYGHVIDALIKHQLVYDRRKKPPKFMKGERRLSHFKL